MPEDEFKPDEASGAAESPPVGSVKATGRKGLALFLGLAFGLSWLSALPLHMHWVSLNPATVQVTGTVMMLTPAIAALVALFTLERPHHLLRATSMWPLPPWRRLVTYLAVALLVPFVLLVGSLVVGTALGWPRPDWSLPLLRETLKLPAGKNVPTPLVALILAGLPINVILSAPLMLGEELGWRGYLLPRLLPLGRWPALVTSGVIWGLWHAPLTSLGYNYAKYPGVRAVLLFTVSCTLFGVIFGWLRLASGSLWPAVVAHATLNVGATAWMMYLAPNPSVDTLFFGLLSVAGWIVASILIVLLELTGQLRQIRGWRPESAAEL